MACFLDAEIESTFVESIETAKRKATVEAVNTGGLAVAVVAIEVGVSRLTMIVELPGPQADILAASPAGRVAARSRGIGSLYLPWSGVVTPQDHIGFLVLRRPIRVFGDGTLFDCDVLRIGIDMPRAYNSIPAGFRLGPTCCSICNWPISAARLTAFPNATVCTSCREAREKELDHGRYARHD